MKTPLPKEPAAREAMLERFRSALQTTYTPEEARRIAKQADERGFLWENQRRFGLHYHALEQYRQGAEVYAKMQAQGIDPFAVLREQRQTQA